jgi:hypothetical protein
MGAHNRDVIAGIADIAVQEKFGAMLSDMSAYRIDKMLRRADMAADGTDIRFDDTNRSFHFRYPQLAGSTILQSSVFLRLTNNRAKQSKRSCSNSFTLDSVTAISTKD